MVVTQSVQPPQHLHVPAHSSVYVHACGPRSSWRYPPRPVRFSIVLVDVVVPVCISCACDVRRSCYGCARIYASVSG